MQAFPALALIIPLVFYGISLWVLWKFYVALARISEELSEINVVLRQRLPPPTEPRPQEGFPGPIASSPQSATP
jgi:hypothetical protein